MKPPALIVLNISVDHRSGVAKGRQGRRGRLTSGTVADRHIGVRLCRWSL